MPLLQSVLSCSAAAHHQGAATAVANGVNEGLTSFSGEDGEVVQGNHLPVQGSSCSDHTRGAVNAEVAIRI